MPALHSALTGLRRALVLAAFFAPAAHAQTTRLIDPTDPVYVDLDRLAAAGLVRTYVAGARPWSRAQIARWLREATERLARGRAISGAAGQSSHGDLDAALRAIIEQARERLDLRFDVRSSLPSSVGRLAPDASLLSAAWLDVTQTNSLTRAVPDHNGLGGITASVNPLLANRQGRPLGRGTSTLLETHHYIESEHFAFAITPLFFARRDDGPSHVDMRLQEVQLRALIRNVAIDIGREYTEWGQGRHGGLLGSENSPPLDQIRLSSERPFVPPWILRHLGPTTLSLLYADLGGDQNFKHPYFVGYKATISPWAPVELGAAVYTKSGGRGSPPASTSARILDAFPFLDAAFFGGKIGTRGSFQFSDRYAGIDGRIRFPSVAGAQLYWEILLNDFDVRRVKSVLWEDAGHIAGFSLPLLAGGRAGVSVELHHTGLRYYEHEQFTSGQTLRGALIGDPLGPDAVGAYADVDWDVTSRQRVTLEGAIERRSNDQYSFLEPPASFGFRRIQTRPKERRRRVLAMWRMLPRRGAVGILTQLGFEQAQNFAFVAGADRSSFLARLAVEYRVP